MRTPSSPARARIRRPFYYSFGTALAALYRACRREGETVRKLVDCLIGSIAIRAGAAVLNNDSDFDVLARHTGLQVDPLD